MTPFLAAAKAAGDAVWARRGLIGVGAAVLLTTFFLGYAKGRTVKPSFPPAPYPPIVQVSKTERETEREHAAEIKRESKIDTDEDIVETRTKLPPRTLADGSLEERIRIQRRTAKNEVEAGSETGKDQVVEKVLEKRIEVPCPTPAPGSPAPATPAQLLPPRYLAGIGVAWDFSLSKTIYGLSGAVRTGPVFWRVLLDSHPQAGLSLEVFW